MNMTPPRSAFGARCSRPEAVALPAVQACEGRLGAAALSPSRGRTQWPGKTGSTGARDWVLGILLSLAATAAQAQTTPVGLWQSIDDKTDKPKAEIRIREGADGVLTGVVERSLQANNDKPNCDLCTDDRKGKPKVGMEIIRGAKKTEGEALWEQGNILDPENGKTYTLRMALLEGGSKLQVRGYIGPFYRTQVWIRVQ